MDRSDRIEPDEVVLGRAAQHDFGLWQKETDTGQAVFAWLCRGRESGPRFLTRRLALEWMANWLEADTPEFGFSAAALHGGDFSHATNARTVEI